MATTSVAFQQRGRGNDCDKAGKTGLDGLSMAVGLPLALQFPMSSSQRRTNQTRHQPCDSTGQSHDGGDDPSIVSPAAFSRRWWMMALAIMLILATVIEDASGAQPISLDAVIQVPAMADAFPATSDRSPPLKQSPSNSVSINCQSSAVIHRGDVLNGYPNTGIGRIQSVGDRRLSRDASQAVFDRWTADRRLRNHRYLVPARSLLPVGSWTLGR